MFWGMVETAFESNALRGVFPNLCPIPPACQALVGNAMDNAFTPEPVDPRFVPFAPGFERLPSTQYLLQGSLFEN